MKNLGGQSS